MNAYPPPPPHPTTAHPARVYNVWLGGKDHYPVDQEAAELAAKANPTIVPSVRANRAFLGRAVRHLTTTGIRQFLDIGTGIPAADNTHEVAQRAAPESRVVYVDNDPVVLTHARALLVSGPDGQTDYVQADARDVDTILGEAARTLDLDRPVGLMLVAVLQYVKDSEDPWDITRRLLDRLAPGSHLVLSHPAADVTAPEVAESMRIYNERAASHASATPRSHEDVERFFRGLEVLKPGVVTLTRWRPAPSDVPDDSLPMWCGVARKP
ncbi:SAM-dependent methyltransferase [Streptomyces sp. NPDC012842]|uniref:SAM-dependent methyltransferase n=1 Tax=Streptomyces pratensis (strain ATCC 33331 / IAF-45CD) TaxID=591167 RepID=A0A8D3WH03_STRFA|nr:SAM-dependent methyltransferase [Streptomyces sp. SID7815]MYT49674.1 SAM-dependent methyltransferase [Streptomyces sp. SID7815]